MVTTKQAQPKHGPVKRITDPAQLARIAERCFKTDQLPEARCKGNVISVQVGDVQREVSDHHLDALIDKNAAMKKGRGLNRKQRISLVNLRNLLCEKGAKGFTERQAEYLGQLIGKVENPKNALAPEEKEERKRQVKAFFDFVEHKRDGRKCPDHIVADFFGAQSMQSVINEVSAILRPYGLAREAESFVKECGRGYINTIFGLLIFDGLSFKEMRGALYRKILNPHSDQYLGRGGFPTLSNLPSKLQGELEKLPLRETTTAKDKLDYLVRSAWGKVGVSTVQGGAPGSGKGGVPQG